MRKAGKKAVSFKNYYLPRFKITARQFNAIARNLEGKVDSVKELLPLKDTGSGTGYRQSEKGARPVKEQGQDPPEEAATGQSGDQVRSARRSKGVWKPTDLFRQPRPL
jgi:hypothetical protein